MNYTYLRPLVPCLVLCLQQVMDQVSFDFLFDLVCSFSVVLHTVRQTCAYHVGM